MSQHCVVWVIPSGHSADVWTWRKFVRRLKISTKGSSRTWQIDRGIPISPHRLSWMMLQVCEGGHWDSVIFFVISWLFPPDPHQPISPVCIFIHVLPSVFVILFVYEHLSSSRCFPSFGTLSDVWVCHFSWIHFTLLCFFFEDFYNSINTVFFICVWKIRFNSKNKCCKFILWNYMVGVNGYIKIWSILMCKIFAWILYVQWVKSIFLRNTQKQNLALLCNDTWWSWLKSLIPTNTVPHL